MENKINLLFQEWHKLGASVLLQKADKAIVIAGAKRGETVILVTPVFDDITIFYSEGTKIITLSG